MRAPDAAISSGRTGSKTMPRPAVPAAAAMPRGRQHAIEEMAPITAATGASFSPCFTLPGGGSFRGNLEGPDEAAAAERRAPGVVEAIARIRILQGVGGHGVLQPGQRRIVDVLVAAGVVGFGHAAGGHFGERSGGEAGGAAVDVAVLDGELDGRGLYLDDVGEQVGCLALGEGDQRTALFGGGAAIHDKHGDGGVDGAMDVAQRVLGAYYAHHAEAGEIHALPGSLGDLPTEDGLLTIDLDFPIGEARTGEDIGGAGFHVVAGQAADGKAGGKRHGGSRAEHGGGTDQFHPINPSDIYYSLGARPGAKEPADQGVVRGPGSPPHQGRETSLRTQRVPRSRLRLVRRAAGGAMARGRRAPGWCRSAVN